VNLLLFVLTVISTYFVGFLWGINYLLAEPGWQQKVETFNFSLFFHPALIRLSLIYSFSLLTIFAWARTGSLFELSTIWY
jgi:hypothetical protein